MMLTNDQYEGLSKLEKWYHKYSHQFIEISGVIGTAIAAGVFIATYGGLR